MRFRPAQLLLVTCRAAYIGGPNPRKEATASKNNADKVTRYQNVKRSASCITRGRSALCRVANVGLTTLISGGKNLTSFKALNASARNCRFILSLREKFLNREISAFHQLGASMMSRPDVPNFRDKVGENAAGLNHYRAAFASSKSEPGVMLLNEEYGLMPVAFARWVIYERPVRLVELTLRCTPVCQEAMAFNCQPPTSRPAARPRLLR